MYDTRLAQYPPIREIPQGPVLPAISNNGGSNQTYLPLGQTIRHPLRGQPSLRKSLENRLNSAREAPRAHHIFFSPPKPDFAEN